MRIDRTPKSLVRRDEIGRERLGERCVHGIIGAHVRAELEHSREKLHVPVSRDGEVHIVGQRFITTVRRQYVRQP